MSTHAIQSFPLVVGQPYRITLPRNRRPGMVYLSGMAKLLAVYADGRARFESEASGETFTINLSDNRIFNQ